MDAIDDRISVSCAFRKFDTVNCVPAKTTPQTAAAGKMARSALPSEHHHDQVGRNEERDRRADAADAGAQAVEGKTGSGGEGGDGDGDRAERHRRGVRQQADGRRAERRHSQARQHRARHRDGSAESRRAFHECAECESDEQRLQARIARQVSDRIFEDFEFAALHRDAIEQDGREHHPPDGKQAERRAVRGRAQRGARPACRKRRQPPAWPSPTRSATPSTRVCASRPAAAAAPEWAVPPPARKAEGLPAERCEIRAAT